METLTQIPAVAAAVQCGWGGGRARAAAGAGCVNAPLLHNTVTRFAIAIHNVLT